MASLKFFSGKLSSHIFIVLIVLGSGILSFSLLSKDHIWNGDSFRYLHQSKSLTDAEAQEFIAQNKFTINNSNRPAGPTAYPWGLPIMLAAQRALFGENIIAFKSINVFFYLLFLLLVWYGLGKELHVISRLVLVSIFAFNPVMLAFHNSIMSDIPFLFFSTLAVLAIGRVAVEKRYFFSQRVDLLLMGFVIALCFFIRSNGLLLLPALFLTQLVSARIARKPYRVKALLEQSGWPFLSFVVTVIIWRSIFPEGGGGHLAYLKQISVTRTLQNINYYIDLPAEFFKTIAHYKLLYGACLVFFIMALIAKIRDDYHIIIYCLLTMMLYVIWPLSWQGLRFIFPVLPFFFLFTLKGLTWPQRFSLAKIKYIRIIFLTLLFAVILLQIRDSIVFARQNLQRQRVIYVSGPYTQPAQDMLKFIKDETASHAVIVFWKPSVLRYFVQRSTIIESSQRALTKADYICIDLRNDCCQMSQEQINAFVKNGQIELKFKNEQFRIYKIRRQSHAQL